MQDKFFLIFPLLFFFVLLPLVIGHYRPIYKAYQQTAGNIINHDEMMRKFVYGTELEEAEIIGALCVKNVADELLCEVDEVHKIMKFSSYGDHRSYYYRISERENRRILELEQVSLIGMQSEVPFKLNPFIVCKLGAELIPYQE